MSKTKLRIAIIDDHIFVHQTYKFILSPFVDLFDDISYYFDGESFFNDVENGKPLPDVCLVDFQIPNKLNGIQIVERIIENEIDTNCIILSAFKEDYCIQHSYVSGALAYLTKNSEVQEILEAINSVKNGNYFINDYFTSELINGKSKPDTKFSQELSEREIQILKALSKGFNFKEIGDQLNISNRTVEFHKEKLFKKLGVNKTSLLVRYAVKMGFE